jgi:hypothetical protein
VIHISTFHIYLKKDLEANPRNPSVYKECNDALAAQSYALQLSNRYDVVLLEIDPDEFNLDYTVNSRGRTRYGHGIIDATFYPKREQLERNERTIESSVREQRERRARRSQRDDRDDYDDRRDDRRDDHDRHDDHDRRDRDIRYEEPRNPAGKLYHAIGILIRLAIVAGLFYFFINALSPDQMVVSTPSVDGNATTNYDAGMGMKNFTHEMINMTKTILESCYNAVNGNNTNNTTV